MKILTAGNKDLYHIKNIVHSTINQIYPKYYPHSVVDFFINYHSEENLRTALNNEYILLLKCEGNIVGTGSLFNNEIRRMFILQDYQGLGYGTVLLNALEKQAFDNGYTNTVLDASLPGYGLYEKRGYTPIKYNKITTLQGQVLCYYKMVKTLINSGNEQVAKYDNLNVLEVNTMDDEIQKILDNFSIDYYGVADISGYEKEITKYGGDLVKGYPKVISLGIVFPSTIIDYLPNRSDNAVALEYYHTYEVINNRLDSIASIISSYIAKKRYKALPIAAAERINSNYINASFSHKMAAGLAGLGWIGKNCLLITPEHGPRVRWISILTDAPLLVTGEKMKQKCGTCMECVKTCPIDALTGENYNEGEEREKRFDVKKCDEYFNSMEGNERMPVCGMCLYACPYGKGK